MFIIIMIVLVYALLVGDFSREVRSEARRNVIEKLGMPLCLLMLFAVVANTFGF